MFRYLSPIALILWATCATAAIQNSDFWFHDDGDIVFIDGQRGAPLHIDYIGAPLAKPLTVRVTPKNSQLKVSPPTCTFTKKDDDCRLIVQLKNQGQKVYGVNQFRVTEAVEGAQGVLNPQAASDASTVGFGVGVQVKDMPAAIPFEGNSRLIITNATDQERSYWGDLAVKKREEPSYYPVKSKVFSLERKRSCYADVNLTGSWDTLWIKASVRSFTRAGFLYVSYFSDITNPSDPIFNGAYKTGALNLTTCSAEGENDCSSNKWASINVGMANIGSDNLVGGLKAGQIEILRDNSWCSNCGSGNSWMYWEYDWRDKDLAFLMIQGSTDGSGFDANAAAPSILEIKSAPPCSNYDITNAIYTVRLKIFGPGSVSMTGNPQCQAFNIPPESFTYCTGSGSRNSWYEMTAVPEAGKTFKGWGSDGLCDDSKTTCRIQLTKDVSLKPYFW